MTRLRGFPPVIDARTRIVILGSFPGAQSLAKRQYYGNPQNQFWRLVGDAIGTDLVHLSYNDRLAALLSHNIGLWDVYVSCEREGSLDGSIRQGQCNDLSKLRVVAPNIKRICCNGQASAARAVLDRCERIVLPSSSPAHTIAYEKKLTVWRAALAK